MFDYQSECHCSKTEVFQQGLNAAIKTLKPRRLLVYGGKGDFDYGDVEIVEYQADTAFRSE